MTNNNNPRTAGNRKAITVIMRSKVTKADVVSLATRLPDDEVEGAGDAFYHQGPRLWAFWCAGLDARKKAKAGQ